MARHSALFGALVLRSLCSAARPLGGSGPVLRRQSSVVSSPHLCGPGWHRGNTGRHPYSAHRCEPAARRRRHGARAIGRHSPGRRHGRQSGCLQLPDTPVQVFLGAGWHRVDPHCDAVVRLRLRRHHLRDLQCRVLHRDVQHAARRLDHSLARAQCGRIARCGAMGDVDRGAAAGRASQYRHWHTHRDWALPGAG